MPEPRQGKNRQHLDPVSDDPSAAVERAVALGATKIGDFDEYGTQWTMLTDPEGNVFDIGVPHEDQPQQRGAGQVRSGYAPEAPPGGP